MYVPTALPANTLSFVGVEPELHRRIKAAPAPAALGALRIGIICNPRAHRNHGAEYAAGIPGADSVLIAAPRTTDDLVATLTGFADRGIDLLVIDGGDGTVRDVLTAAGQLWRRSWPAIVVIPSGKTNALAIDLGIPTGWSLTDALTAIGHGRTVTRRPIEIGRNDKALPLRGFLFGTGAFVKATALAQHTHKAGAFNGIAVGLALGWAVMLTMFGGKQNEWRAGDRMDVRLPGGAVESDPLYLLLASTLKRMPVGLKPFGRTRDGLKLLTIDAPPRWLPVTAPALLSGSEARWLDRAGFHNRDTASFDVAPEDGFILDGELFEGGALSVRQGPVLSFVVP